MNNYSNNTTRPKHSNARISFSIFFALYVKSSIHVALAIYALLQVSCLTFDLPYSENLSYTVFYGSILGYNFIKYGGLWITSTKVIWNRPFLVFSVVTSFIMCYYLVHLDIRTIVCLGMGLILSILYTIPIYGKKNLRDLRTLKIFIVAITWIIATCISAFTHHKTVFNLPFLTYTFSIFLWVLCLMIPFELRDFNEDPKHLKTLPQRYGVKSTKNIGSFLVLLLFVLLFIKEEVYINKALIIQSFIYLLTLLGIRFSNTKQSKYYSSFFIESLPILWWILLVII